MTKTRAWPVRAMYMLVAFALVISLMISAAPTQSVSAASPLISRWDRVTTPSNEDWVLAPDSVIVDYAVGDEGRVAYAILDGWDLKENEDGFFLLKSTDHAATWKDITDKLEREITRAGLPELCWIERVAVAPDDPDFVAVALWLGASCDELRVFISKDGGTTFRHTGEGISLDWVYDFAISPADDDGWRDMAIGGIDLTDGKNLWRSRARETSATGWVDATNYDGWLSSEAVGAIAFAPSWNKDQTILVVTGDYNTSPNMVHLQSGTWGTDVVEAWNDEAGFAEAVVILDQSVDGSYLPDPLFDTGRWTAGIALPTDYEGRHPTKRFAWVWVNYFDVDQKAVGEIYVVDDEFAQPVREQIRNKPWLANVSYWGTIDSGKAIAGVLGTGTWDEDPDTSMLTDPCAGVQVYRYDTVGPNMDICCPAWKPACKLPTGRFAMEAFYVKEDKAYAVALGVVPWHEGFPDWMYDMYGDESAWSFSFDDGDTWNQLSLIDTWITYLSDVAVSPNCNKTMAVSVNYGPEWGENGRDERLCDSVWYMAENQTHAPEYSGKWMRTWAGKLQGHHPETHTAWGLLRLAPEEIDGETVYLVDVGTNYVYYNDMQTLACWEPGRSTITEIIDLAVKDEKTIYALGLDGLVAMSDDYGSAPSWTKPVDTDIEAGWTIAVHGDDVIVGGQYGNWNYSTDGGKTWDDPDLDLGDEDLALPRYKAGFVTVVFDSYYDANNMIYAAFGWGDDNGIYRWIIGESREWTSLRALPYDYTGLVVDNADGNPMTSPATGGVLYASYIDVDGTLGPDYDDPTVYTGVARLLKPADDFCCDDTDWDYLWVSRYFSEFQHALFFMAPHALKICGCLEPDSSTKLFAIGLHVGYIGSGEVTPSNGFYPMYDMAEAKWGTVWTWEDCFSKSAPTLRTPADGTLVPDDGCCAILPFLMEWTRLCDACNYQIEIALDSGFTQGVMRYPDYYWWDDPIRPVPATAPSWMFRETFLLNPGTTYYWRIRSLEAEIGAFHVTGQVIRSWWSTPLSFTTGLFAGTGVELISPEPGATNVARTNLAFTWSASADVDSFSFVLSPNADLSGSVATSNGPNTGYTFTGALSPNTSYYWRVTGIKDGAATSQAMATFRTSAAEVFCSPQSGLCFNTEAELRAHHEQLHKDAMRTPAWVWVIIALGAVLVIVVIVLIFRTRRV